MIRSLLISKASTARRGNIPEPEPEPEPEPQIVDVWDPATVTEPGDYSALSEGSYNWQNPSAQGLRFSFHHSGALYSIINDGDRDLFQFNVTPRVPDFSGTSQYHYRAEVTRDWESGDPIGTKEWLSWGYVFPELLPRTHEVDIHQKHSGSADGYSSNAPIYYFGLAYEGQEGAVENELVIVNKVKGFESATTGRYNTGIVIEEGKEYHFVTFELAGRGINGQLKVWIMNVTDNPGVWTLIYDENESTVWGADADGGSNSLVKGDWKLGAYAHGLKDLSGVQADEAVNSGSGSYSFNLHMTEIKNKILLAADELYDTDLFDSVATISGTIAAPVALSRARMEYGTYVRPSGGGNEYYLVWLPRGYDQTNKEYKVGIWTNGDGGDGNPTVVTNQNLTGSGTSWGGNFTNPSVNNEVVWGTVVIKVSGVEVARGQSDGTIIGDGVTGTMNHMNAAGSFSVTFDEAPGANPTVDYLYSPTMEAGIPARLNAGDLLDDDTIVVIVHKAADNSYYSVVNHFDAIIDLVLPNYRFDSDRVGVMGLSRGGVHVINLMSNRQDEICCFINASGPIVNTPTYADLYDKGILLVGGQADQYTMPHEAFMNALNSHTDWRFHPYFIYLDGVGHNNTAWNTNCYNRSTAPIDWVEWFSLWNLDIDKQTANFVRRAEETVDYDDYRRARRAVSFLTAGAFKTNLENRLATVKESLPTWVWLDIGANTTSDDSINYWTGAFTPGSSMSALTDDDGEATGIGFAVVDQLTTAASPKLATSTRHNTGGWGFDRTVFNDGAAHETSQTGQLKWTGLTPSAAYRVRLYFIHNTATVTSVDVKPSVTINGQTKTTFSQLNNVTSVLDFTGRTANGSGELAFTYSSVGVGMFQVAGITEE